MKKIYTLASALLLGFGVSFAQNASSSLKAAKSIRTIPQENSTQDTRLKVGKAAHQSIVGKSRTALSTAKATPFYTHDFSATDATSWTPASDNVDVMWNISSVSDIDAGYFFGASQGEYAWINSDAAGSGGGAYDATITSPVIDCSSQSSVSLSFKQIYRSYAETTAIEVSNDGGANFTSFPCNTTGTDLGDDVTPDVFTLNISSVAASQTNVVIRIRITGDWDWYWSIDDVALSGLDPYDLAIAAPILTQYEAYSGLLGMANTMTPRSQRDSVLIWAECSNIGANDQDYQLNAKVNLGASPDLYDATGSYSDQIGNAASVSGDIDTLYATDDFLDGRHLMGGTLGTVGTYTITQTVLSTFTDANTADNSMTSTYMITDTVMAKEKGVIEFFTYAVSNDTGTPTLSSNSNRPTRIGNAFYIKNAGKAKSVSFVISNRTVTGTRYRVQLYKLDLSGPTATWVLEGSSSTYTSTAGDKPTVFVPSNKWITIGFPSSIDLTSETEYMAAVERIWDPTLTTTATFGGSVFSGSGEANSNSFFVDNDVTWVWGYDLNNNVWSDQPYFYNQNDIALIRLNTVECDMMIASATPTQPTCNLSNGSIAVSTSGGNTPYSYTWSPIALGTNVATATGLGAGTYNVIVTDKYGCAKTLVSTLTNVGASTTVSTTFTQSTSCSAANGDATVTFVSGPAITSYSWSNGQTTATAVGLDGGTYIVTFTNVDGCKGTASQIVTEAGSPALTLSATASTPVACFGGNGSVQVSLSGAPAYPVNFTLGTNSLSGSAPVTFTVAANSYALSAVDANGCNFTASNFVLTQPAQLVNGTAAKTNINCFGEATGSISITGVTGGTTPYSYIWGGSATGTNTTGSIASLAAGTYTITVKDANNCAASGSIANQVLTQPATLVSLSVVDVLLTGTRRVKLSITGGVAPYSITSAGTTVSPSTAGAAGEIIVSLGAGGDRVIKVTDANGCFVEETALSVGLKEVASVNNLSVYPNPTENNVTISFNSTEAKNVTVKLVSLNGQEIFTQELPQFVGEYSKTVNLSTQAQGVYFLQIVSDKNVTTKKVVKL
ncbi:MAG: T9SS type A sorting domain-containing protein [Bacteroidota bacterium]